MALDYDEIRAVLADEKEALPHYEASVGDREKDLADARKDVRSVKKQIKALRQLLRDADEPYEVEKLKGVG